MLHVGQQLESFAHAAARHLRAAQAARAARCEQATPECHGRLAQQRYGYVPTLDVCPQVTLIISCHARNIKIVSILRLHELIIIIDVKLTVAKPKECCILVFHHIQTDEKKYWKTTVEMLNYLKMCGSFENSFFK